MIIRIFSNNSQIIPSQVTRAHDWFADVEFTVVRSYQAVTDQGRHSGQDSCQATGSLPPAALSSSETNLRSAVGGAAVRPSQSFGMKWCTMMKLRKMDRFSAIWLTLRSRRKIISTTLMQHPNPTLKYFLKNGKIRCWMLDRDRYIQQQGRLLMLIPRISPLKIEQRTHLIRLQRTMNLSPFSGIDFGGTCS